MGITRSRNNWMPEYIENQNINQITSNYSFNENFPSILPIGKRIAAKTIGLDLVQVFPIGGGNNSDELNEIKREVRSENRNRRIESIIDNKEFEEMKVEDHPNYIKPKGPSVDLFYIDFKYGSD